MWRGGEREGIRNHFRRCLLLLLPILRASLPPPPSASAHPFVRSAKGGFASRKEESDDQGSPPPDLSPPFPPLPLQNGGMDCNERRRRRRCLEEGESLRGNGSVLRRETAFPFQERRGGSWRTYLCAFTPLVYVPSRTHKHSALSYGRSEITEPYSWQKISLILLSPLRGQRLNLDIARAILSQRERVSSSSLVNPHPTSASLFYTNRLEEEDGNASPPPPPPVFCPHPFSLKTALLSSSPVAASALGLTGCQQMRERRGKHYLTKRQLL